jgi:hypothetical protein
MLLMVPLAPPSNPSNRRPDSHRKLLANTQMLPILGPLYFYGNN